MGQQLVSPLNVYILEEITGMFTHVNVGKYGLAALIRIASSPFGVFQEND